MGGETSDIGKMAQYVSAELFDWFKWKRHPPADTNFECMKVDKHAPKKSKDGHKHTHPVDSVFSYLDPYQNKVIYVNTDLKSYAKSTIIPSTIFLALKSLAQTIDCARVSVEWQHRYGIQSTDFVVIGMLFIYNHDNEYDRDFFELLAAPVKKRGKSKESSVRLETLPVEAGQSIALFEPRLISYLTTVIIDTKSLHSRGTFPEKKFEFYYPELRMSRTHGEKYERAATIEMMAGPYLMIRHEAVSKYNEESKQVEIRYREGFLIYYNRPGSSPEEFVYFLDMLAGYQILDGDHMIRIRFAHHSQATDIKSNFRQAVARYAQDWGFDLVSRARLESIEYEPVEIYRYSFSKTTLAWDRP